MCAKHNAKVVRVVKPRRMRVVDKNSAIGWKMSEVTILACPVSQKLRDTRADSRDFQSSEKCTANKKAWIV